MEMRKQYDKDFKENAVRYVEEHKDISVRKCSENLGVSTSTLNDWVKAARDNNGVVQTRGSGNYSSDEAKENARLKRELRDTRDALDILKRSLISIN